jgi:hypothetical protein
MRPMLDHAPVRLAPIALALAAFLAAVSSVQAQTHRAPGSAEYPFGFRAYGVFSQMITQRNYRPVAVLKEAADGRTTDAVRAVSGSARFQ